MDFASSKYLPTRYVVISKAKENLKRQLWRNRVIIAEYEKNCAQEPRVKETERDVDHLFLRPSEMVEDSKTATGVKAGLCINDDELKWYQEHNDRVQRVSWKQPPFSYPDSRELKVWT
jgi:hypothetical protein